MNDRAHCLKCDAVLKTQATIHGAAAVPENMEKDLHARTRMDPQGKAYVLTEH